MPGPNVFPKSVKQMLQCPFCGRVYNYTAYLEIHIPGDSDLKKKILNKTLFFPRCPRCGKEFKLKPSCIYRDDNKRLMIIATDSSDAALENLLKSGNIRFNDVRNDNDMADFMKGMYTRRIVHDVDAFREKILLSDNNYDDRIIELMKLSLSGLMKREHSEPVYRVFLEDLTRNLMEFTVITG